MSDNEHWKGHRAPTLQQRLDNWELAVRVAVATLERVNANHGKGLQLIDPDDEDRTWDLDDWIAEWGIQGAVNELQDALKGKLLEK